MSPAVRTSHSPPSHDEEVSGTGLHSRSRNARAQARHRAKRKRYIETLEESVKRLQAIVDAAGLDPTAFPPVPAHPCLRQLQDDNARLRREADALRVQIAALSAHVAAGPHVTPRYAPSPPPSDAHSPPPEHGPKRRKMSVERDHLYLDPHPGRTPSLAHPLLSLQHQAVCNSLLASHSHQSRPTTPPVPVSPSFNNNSLLATSLYPLLTLGIAGGAVSGQLGAAAWNTFQQSQLAQHQPSLAGLAQGLGHGLGSGSLAQSSGLGSHGHALGSLGQTSLSGLDHPSFMPHPQPMSTLDSIRPSSPGAGPSSPTRFEPLFDRPPNPNPNSNPSPHLNPSPHMISSTSSPLLVNSASPHMITSTPPGFPSHTPSGRRSSSSSRRDDAQ